MGYYLFLAAAVVLVNIVGLLVLQCLCDALEMCQRRTPLPPAPPGLTPEEESQQWREEGARIWREAQARPREHAPTAVDHS